MQQRIPYDGNDLGAVYTKKYTAFRLLGSDCGCSNTVSVSGRETGPMDTLPMKRDVQGTWTIRVDGRFAACLYIPSGEKRQDRGVTWDPYSVAVGVNGQRSMVLTQKETDPENFKEDHGPVFQTVRIW